MEAETQSQTTKIKFVPFHQTKEGIVTGELRTDGSLGGQFVCNIEESNAKEIIKAVNMHDELVSLVREMSVALQYKGYDKRSVNEESMYGEANKLLQQAEQK